MLPGHNVPGGGNVFTAKKNPCVNPPSDRSGRERGRVSLAQPGSQISKKRARNTKSLFGGGEVRRQNDDIDG